MDEGMGARIYSLQVQACLASDPCSCTFLRTCVMNECARNAESEPFEGKKAGLLLCGGCLFIHSLMSSWSRQPFRGPSVS